VTLFGMTCSLCQPKPATCMPLMSGLPVMDFS